MIVFDRAAFDAATAGDRELQREVLALFRGQVAGWRVAFAGEDWRTAVHTLKGSARGIGLPALAQACAAAEEAGAEGLAGVEQELARALAALDQ
ncbi:MAG: Hpt domain-containing protein [Hyphomonadaceae bacterium]|nr:Hpt domain-containing protein [Hyphomonadaceae bacterium]